MAGPAKRIDPEHWRLYCPTFSNRTVPRRSKQSNDTRPRGAGFFKNLQHSVLYLFNHRCDVGMSRLTDKARKLPGQDLRKAIHHQFHEMRMLKINQAHSHSKAASLRTSASLKIHNVVLDAGLTPYYVSMSARTAEHDGCRYNYMEKDLDKSFQDTRIRPDHCLIMIDVDYHVESLNRYLEYGNPLLIYTFVPEKAAGATSDAVFSITDDEVTYRVNGGAVYKHKLWRYEGDTISVIDKYGNLLVYNIEQTVLASDPQRRIIGFYPTMTAPKWTYRKPKELGVSRYRFSDGNGYNMVTNPVKDTVSFSQSGSYTSGTMPISVYGAIKIRLSHSSKPVVSDVERILSASNVVGALLMAPMLYDKLMCDAKNPLTRILDVTSSTGSVIQPAAVNFQAIGPLATEDGKPMGRAVAPSILTNSGVFPCRSYNNDVATVHGRITSIANFTVPPVVYEKYADELLDLLVPIAGIGVPLSVEEVYEKQSKPAQRARADRGLPTVTGSYTNRVKAFIKAEAYNNPTDPRNITTVDNAHQMLYSGFTLAFKADVLSGRDWYASDMKPSRIAERIQEVARHPDGLIVSDYSRLDGHISPYEKTFKNRVYIRWCAPEYRAQLGKILAQDTDCKGVTTHGVRYSTGSSQLSGSPGTTPDNNLVTALHDYTAFRELGYPSDIAWALFNQWVVGASDDRVRANLPGLSDSIERVCRLHGHKLKNAVFPQDDAIIFLGRLIPHPATSLTSMQDPYRTLAKLHLTSAPEGTDELAALRNKALGYIVTDEHSPIIGAWCAKVLELTQHIREIEFTNEEHWKVSNGPWPLDNVEMLYDCFCDMTGLSSGEVADIEAVCRRAKTISELPDSMLDNGHMIKVSLAVALDGFVLTPDSHSDSNQGCQSTTPTLRANSPSSATGRSASFERQLNLLYQPPLLGTNTCTGTEPTPPPSTEEPQTSTSESCCPCSRRTRRKASPSPVARKAQPRKPRSRDRVPLPTAPPRESSPEDGGSQSTPRRSSQGAPSGVQSDRLPNKQKSKSRGKNATKGKAKGKANTAKAKASQPDTKGPISTADSLQATSPPQSAKATGPGNG